MKPTSPPRNHIASRDYTIAIRGRLLDDATIERYILAGYYGTERRNAFILAQEQEKQAKAKKTSSLKQTLYLLGID